LLAEGSTPDVEALAGAVQRDILSAQDIMLNTCDKATPHCGRHCFDKKQHRTYNKLIEESRTWKTLIREIDSSPEMTPDQVHGILQEAGVTDLEDFASAAEARTLSRDRLIAVQKRSRAMREEKQRRQKDAEKAAFQSRLAKQPGKAHREIMRDETDDTCMHAEPLRHIKDPLTGITHSDQEMVMSLIRDGHFQPLLAPTHIIKTGNYTPDTRGSFRYPFDPSGPNPDPFTLTSANWSEDGEALVMNPPTGGETDDQADVFELLADKCTYQGQVKHLKKGKKPGPDDVPNELLKILPESMHTTIHALFQIMWLTGITPQAWKESVTSLLYKKGDPYLVANYRPIGMANAMYKLWTSNITHVTLHYALRNKIIHRCQEGGILGRDTRRQLRNHINIFEDAFHTKQDLYCLYIDFKNAFNMVDHDKLFVSCTT
jgi:hypothetical protein